MADQESTQQQRSVAKSDAATHQHGAVPDTAETYERAKPDKETGMGQMTGNQFTPTDRDDEADEAVTNQSESRELTADDAVDQRDTPDLSKPSAGGPRGTAADAADPAHHQQPRGQQHQQARQQNLARQGREQRPAHADVVKAPGGHDPSKPISPQPDHSMNQEEPLGWDQAPKGKDDMPAANTRHPRQGGKGGTPDVGEENAEG